ncbi:2-dehydro-3-deoxy-D-gluconate 5-dehydrogenase KduD [Vallitalea pronyensis]|uniref:2-dehydro-3-deoxy-D-gluconate 5-dehydrogenase n=1 Tax=Vallitalea pronyensis TaxID=1348613 RepID=A0A8J8MP69_9FIRM|nr:2-dehydro-3-deoxy-D-gluconate 5-dehydrogenase KduD [Vallitalea pronyensis]QUI25430.1 2-dehydro-3-deoxy-D-gluconate 5-dehydrogenase KduD [Vallitalea pronyensis]
MILDQFNLDGKVAIVTGASTGLGQGMTLGLLEAGATVVGVDYVEMTDTAKLAEERGAVFHGIVANLMTTDPIEGIIAETVSKFGQLNILVNNAGIIRREDAINFKETDWDDVLNLNLKTVFFFAQAAAKQFIKQGTPGNIISVASMLSFQGGIRVPSYTASKSGVMGITRAMANEWAKHDINVNAIAPGYMATNNTAALRADQARNKAILERIPSGRWGNIEDLQGAVVFLASDASRYVQGYTMAVDGGWLAR